MGGVVLAERSGRAIIDLAALRANFRIAEQLAGGREVIAVVKADAYGHGAPKLARALVAAGCTRLAVVDVHEGQALRDAGVSVPVLVMGGVHDPGQAALAANAGLTVALHEASGLALLREAARRSGRRVGVEVEIDTGMRRMGVPAEGAPDWLADWAPAADLELEGVYTHFASADHADLEHALDQVARFRDFLRALEARGVRPKRVHAANSAALLAGREFVEALPEATAVRPGLMLYGARSAAHQDPERALEPVMSVRTRVAAIRDIEAGEGVGYGASWRAKRATRIATVPLGYADGVLRALSSAGAVWIGGRVHGIVGRVSMDYVTVDVGDHDVAVGDEVTLIGRPSEASEETPDAEHRVAGFGPGPGIAVEEQAHAAGTLAYELLVRVGERLPRRHIGDD